MLLIKETSESENLKNHTANTNDADYSKPLPKQYFIVLNLRIRSFLSFLLFFTLSFRLYFSHHAFTITFLKALEWKPKAVLLMKFLIKDHVCPVCFVYLINSLFF